mgnify:CR=1 FL=1
MIEEGLTLLTEAQVFDATLDVLRKFGTETPITDLAILTGAVLKDKNETKGSIGWGFTKTLDAEGIVYPKSGSIVGVYEDGSRAIFYKPKDVVAIRPVLSSSEVLNRFEPSESYNGVKEIEYGEYPQSSINNERELNKYVYNKYTKGKTLKEALEVREQLEAADVQRLSDLKRIDNSILKVLPETGGIYTLNQGREYKEYEFKNNRYIRVENVVGKVVLSNGRQYEKGDYVWIKVEPVVWLVDQKTKTVIAKNGLVSGIEFDNKKYDGNFEKTNLYNFLQNIMFEEMFRNESLKKKVGPTIKVKHL